MPMTNRSTLHIRVCYILPFASTPVGEKQRSRLLLVFWLATSTFCFETHRFAFKTGPRFRARLFLARRSNLGRSLLALPLALVLGNFGFSASCNVVVALLDARGLLICCFAYAVAPEEEAGQCQMVFKNKRRRATDSPISRALLLDLLLFLRGLLEHSLIVADLDSRRSLHHFAPLA